MNGLWLSLAEGNEIPSSHIPRGQRHRQPGRSCHHRRSAVFFWGFGFLPQATPAQSPPPPKAESVHVTQISAFVTIRHLEWGQAHSRCSLYVSHCPYSGSLL